MSSTDRRVAIGQTVIVTVLLGTWELSAHHHAQATFFFSRPSAIAERLTVWMSTAALWRDVGITLLETLLGFAVGVTVGIALAFLCYRRRLASRVLMPFLEVANGMPRLVLGPLFVLWFGLGFLSKAMLGATVVVFVVFFATYQGLLEVDQNLILKVRLLGGTDRDVTRHVLLPSVLSWVFTSLRSSVGFALVGAVVGEYMGASAGLGHRIEFAENMFDATGVFAGLVMLALMVAVLNAGLRVVELGFSGQDARPWHYFKRVAWVLAVAGVAVIVFTRGDADHVAAGARIQTSMATGGRAAMIFLPAAVAEYHGDFQREGLNVVQSDVKGGAVAAQALLSGGVQFASMALDHVVKARVHGADLVMLVLYLREPGLTLIVDDRLRDRVQSVADLKGLRVGVTGLGSGSHMALLALLRKNGLAASDVTVVASGPTTTLAALNNGSIDAAVTAEPFVAQGLESGHCFTLVDITTPKETAALYGSDYPFTGLATRRDVVKSSPELVGRMVAATYRALRFIHENDAAAVAKVLPSEFRPDLDLYIQGLAHTMPAFSEDGMITHDGAVTVIQSLKDSGVVPSTASIDADAMIDLSFLKTAIERDNR